MNISSDYSSVRSLTSSAASTSTTKTALASANTTTSGNYIDQLKSKFRDLNITTGNYSGSPTGTGVQGNVMISPKLLAKAESDPAVAKELETNLSGIPEAEAWLKNQCASQGMNLDACGICIDEDGNMSSWAQTTSTSAGATDDEDDKKLEKKRAEKKAQEERTQDKKEEAEQADAAVNTRSAYYAEYEGAYGTLMSSTGIPYSLNVYA